MSHVKTSSVSTEKISSQKTNVYNVVISASISKRFQDSKM